MLLSRVPASRLWLLTLASALLFLGPLSPSQHSNPRDHIGPETSSGHRRQVPTKGPPVLGYWIFGTKGDGQRILRLLKAVYHPRNHYLLQLDAASSYSERLDLALLVRSERVFRDVGNVDVVGQSNALNRVGSSALAAVLHAAALLLKVNADWDWFVTLSASDYPLVSQDDLLHGFTFLPKDLNLISYTNKTGWIERQNVTQIVDDPSLYLEKNTPIMYATETRTTPDVFNIFGGSPWVILTRRFMDYCVRGWDNLPRKLLMYFSNVAYPAESYFHTVLCSSDEFRNTIVDSDLRFEEAYDETLNMSHYDDIVDSGAAFAGPFQGDSLLNKIDRSVLRRAANGIVPGEWCIGLNSSREHKEDLCSSWDNIDVVKPGDRGFRLEAMLSKVVAERRLGNSNLCHSFRSN